METLKGKLRIILERVGVVQTNCYIVGLEGRKQCVVIDPGGEPEKILHTLDEGGLEPEGILLTHGHFDHILGVEAVRERGIKVYLLEEERELASNTEMNCSAKLRRVPCKCEPDVALRDGEVVSLAGMDIKVIHTPGHTAGSACYYLEEHGVLFSGDTLFWQSVGRTDLPTGSMERLESSIRDKLFSLADGVRVYPGHGGETTIGHEKGTMMGDGVI